MVTKVLGLPPQPPRRSGFAAPVQVFSLAGIAALGGLVWMGCSSDDSDNKMTTTGDAGADSGPADTKDAGDAAPDPDSGTKQQPGVEVTYGECPAFTKCDSDPIGKWTVTGGCLSKDAFAPAKQKCPGLEERDVKITAEGTVEVTATNVKRATTIYLSGKFLVPKCNDLMSSCAVVAAGLRGGLFGLPVKEAECTAVGDKCDCAVESELSDNTDSTYTANNGTLTTQGTNEQSYDFCVEGNKIQYQETTEGTPLGFIIEMTK